MSKVENSSCLEVVTSKQSIGDDLAKISYGNYVGKYRENN